MFVRAFREWWLSPTTAGDRVYGAMCGAWAGFWMAGLARFFAGLGGDVFMQLFIYAVGGALILGVAGVVFPKPVTVISFPFTFFAFSWSG